MSPTFLLILIIVFFPVLLWKTFETAGHKGWFSALPVFNYYIWLKIIDKPLWWFILLFTPFINAFMVMLMVVETLKCYKIHDLGSQAIAVLFPYAYLPWLSIKKEKQYTLPENRVKIRKTPVREWVDAIIFAVIAATIIRTFMIEAYTIPTSSMEKSLLVGDFLFVSKLSYGPKVPNTPLAFPFVHHTMPLSESAKSYVEWIKLPYYRFPGTTSLKRNDVVVFNYPDGDTVALKVQNQSYYSLIRDYGRQRVWSDKLNFGDVVARPVDKRENYIKRCVAVAGDTLQIKNQIVYINGKPSEFPENSQFKYLVRTDGSKINPKALEKLDIIEDILMTGPDEMMLTLTSESAEKIKGFINVKEVKQIIQPQGFWQPYIFPFDSAYAWNFDNYGPLVIPKAGVTVELNVKNIVLYSRIIKNYENNSLEIIGDKIIINGTPSTTYTFKMDYYWMMGDNRHNSADSRFWGFVPYDHIVGKAVFVWLSLDNNKPLFGGKIRFNKLFRTIN
ncbi:MAG: signal peptidase I [Bacteroidetes bacterium HGW-Bacteroidetes-11]|jgi:signal peptidase I|nr:MAG: signal peptidase I [Bacteroidetes bacterium HGW-Bacteroidetes-11]